MTLDQALVLYAGYFTEQQIRSAFANLDVNENGFVCRKHPPGFDNFVPLNLTIDDLSARSQRPSG